MYRVVLFDEMYGCVASATVFESESIEECEKYFIECMKDENPYASYRAEEFDDETNRWIGCWLPYEIEAFENGEWEECSLPF